MQAQISSIGGQAWQAIVEGSRFLWQNCDKEGATFACKTGLALYGYYWSVRLAYLAIKTSVNVITTRIKNNKVASREMSEVFGDSRREWVVITGATSGIGLELAKIVNLSNMNVLLVSRDEKKLQLLCDSFKSDLRITKAAYAVIDFEHDSTKKIFKVLEQALIDNSIEEIKLLINNVGAMKLRPFVNYTYREAVADLNVNLKSHVAMTLFFENKIKKRVHGDHSGIIFIGSMLGLYPMAGFGVYPYTKCFLNTFSTVVDKVHHHYYDTMISAPGKVLTAMNNPMKNAEVDYTKVDINKLGSDWISAHECAKFTLLNFGHTRYTAGHPKNENLRQYYPYIAFLLRMRFLSIVRKMKHPINPAPIAPAPLPRQELDFPHPPPHSLPTPALFSPDLKNPAPQTQLTTKPDLAETSSADQQQKP